MFIKDNKYLIGLKHTVVYTGETDTHHIFKGDTIEFYVSKANVLSVRQVFKYIKL